MKKLLFALLVFITSTASAQNWRFQNDTEDGVTVWIQVGGSDPSANFFALLSNENDFDVHATLYLETDLKELRREIDVVIPAGADQMMVPIDVDYWKNWRTLEASASGTRLDLIIHEPHLTRKLWNWMYLPRQFRHGNLYPKGMETGNGHYFYD